MFPSWNIARFYQYLPNIYANSFPQNFHNTHIQYVLYRTLILLDKKVPRSWLRSKNILHASWKCFRLSASEMNSVLAAQ